jgi:hypothetical protein
MLLSENKFMMKNIPQCIRIYMYTLMRAYTHIHTHSHMYEKNAKINMNVIN